MSYPVLGRADDALDAAETTEFLARRLGDDLLSTTDEFGTYTVTVTPAAWVHAITLCRDEDLLAYDMFDSLFGVDAGEDGLDVVAILYSTSRGRRILLRARADGGRDNPTMPSVTGLFPGANWMERETWDMFGIEFEGHPGLAPRILTVENFEGWPLRKDFLLASRAAKPWPGVKEPAETDEDGNVIVKVPGPGEAPGPSGLDEIIAKQSRLANALPGSEAPEPEFAPEDAAADAEVAAAAEAATESEVTEEQVAEDDAAAADAASARADDVRQAQAEARAERAADQAADTTEGTDDDTPAIPEGTPPPADDADDADGERGQP